MNSDNISTRKLMFTVFTALCATGLISYTTSYTLCEMGVSPVISIIVGIVLGFTLPNRIAVWILKEELLAIKSELDGKRD